MIMTSVVVILMRSRKSEAMSHLTGAFCFKHGFIVQNTCFDDEGTRFFFATNRVFCHKRRVGSQKGPMAHCSMMQEVPCTWSTCYNCCTCAPCALAALYALCHLSIFSHLAAVFLWWCIFTPIPPIASFRRASICSTYPSQSLCYHPACTYS